MAKNLVIVESPAKAKTLSKYLGTDFIVKSSFGHIRDLPKKGLNIDVEHDFKPTYEISPDKKKVVAELKKSVTGNTVWLATDEDREGEAIAWHLCEALKLPAKSTKRIVFHEITKTAIEKAIENPRTLDNNLVDAQQARRVLDRIVGYELSPVLWKKVRPGLSAGRVQSVAVRLIVEREREIKDFKATAAYKVTGTFKIGSEELNAELANKLADEQTATEFLNDCSKAQFRVTNISKKPATRSPSPPFTTSTLQQEAARKLGFGVKQTMVLAQRLYEEGHITYMRTDSVTLSDVALEAAKFYINMEYGSNYYARRQYQTKSHGAQEAHEAIRPTDFKVIKAGADSGTQKLYQLIWRRALASQMSAATIDRTEVEIAISNRKEHLVAKGELLNFDGFFKVYGGTKDDVILPPVKVGQALELKTMQALEAFEKLQGRYSEASLVRKLEELGIGRPSTYAPTISTIQSRGYVEKADVIGEERNITLLTLQAGKVTKSKQTIMLGADKNKLVPTYLAEVTTDFLVKHFPSIVDYDFTAKAEEELDDVADGKLAWVKMMERFYKLFKPLVKSSEKVSREEASQARILGKDPVNKKPIMARFGRYGPMLQRGEATDDNKPDFAPMPDGTTLENITLGQALPMFDLPRTVGKTEDGQTILANIGRFGPYIQVGKTFVSIKPLDPFSIKPGEAIKLYQEKLTQKKDKYIKEYSGGLKIARGPYGPYVTNGKKNAAIPKDQDPAKITEAQAKEMLAKTPAKKRRFIPRKS